MVINGMIESIDRDTHASMLETLRRKVKYDAPAKAELESQHITRPNLQTVGDEEFSVRKCARHSIPRFVKACSGEIESTG